MAANERNDPLEMLLQTPSRGMSSAISSWVGEELEAGVEAVEDLQILLHTLHQLYQHSREQQERLEQEVAELGATCSQLHAALEEQRLAVRRATRECEQLREAVYVQAMLAKTGRRSRGVLPYSSTARQGALADSTPAAGERLAPEVPSPVASEQSKRVPSQDERPDSLRLLQRAAPGAQNVHSAGPGDELDEPLAATTITVLRVPNAKTAQALYQMLAALPGMAHCSLQRFEGGQLVVGAALEDGVTLQVATQHLRMTNLRVVKREAEALVLQYL